MLKLILPAAELYDESTMTFFTTKEQQVVLEHSLVSLSKWESKWRKPFLSKEAKSMAEFTDYIRCMTLTQNVDPNAYSAITPDILRQVTAYIDAPMTATTISGRPRRASREILTSEVIYWQMFVYGIPIECQKWHLNRLLTLLNVFAAKSAKPEKIPSSELLSRNRALNAARRKQFHTRG